MKILRIAICDDDQIMQTQVYELLKKYFSDKHIKVEIKIFSDGDELIKDSSIYDIIVLDIEMERKNGFDVKEDLFWKRVPSKIIFLTDHDELMGKAFGKLVYGFVSKNKIESIYHYLDTIIKEYKTHQVITIAGEKFDIYNILYIQGCRSYCIIYMMDQTNKIVRKNLSEMEQLLNENLFIRIHRSYVINVIHIKECRNKNVILKNNTQIPVSKKYKELLQSAFFQYIGSME